MENNIKNLFKLIDINENNGLATIENVDKMTNFQKLFFKQAHEKMGVSAVYFLRDSDGIAKIPTIYFYYLDEYNPQKIAELHRLAWNTGEAPLLFVVTPDQLLIYNNYDCPKESEGVLDPEAGLVEVIKLVSDLETQREALWKYNRTLLETGEYWRRNQVRFDTKTRVDHTLIFNLKYIRKNLINRIQNRRTTENPTDIAAVVHSLLCRSMLIKYLEERKDGVGNSVLPANFYNQFYVNASSYTDVLCDKDAAYNLFEYLHVKFNGDMLPAVQNEYEIIEKEDLLELREFLLGNLYFEDGQLALWPLYSFDIIPIQLISSIYELFFHLSDNEDDKGTYYTPLHLVDMILDEVYPWDGDYHPIKVLDPACGSGIFLVEIYRRIVCRWIKANKIENVTNDQLKNLMEETIYGVDSNREAVRVASFSLSLAMCDFLEAGNIWEQLRFPGLVDRNLTDSDFFDDKEAFNQHKFDLIIGNPPWQNRLTSDAVDYLQNRKKVIGDKQIAQAFSIKCSDLCKKTGNICLLMPSKGLLFNRSSKSVKYRENFFGQNTVLVIINLSAYRKFLFSHGNGPAAVVVYKPIEPEHDHVLLYCTPKPLYTVEDLRKFTIEPNDICRIPQVLAFHDKIWKVAMWGMPRDLELINKIDRFCPLKMFLEKNGMSSAEGYKRGNRTKYCADFWGCPIVTAKNFKQFYQNESELGKVDFYDYECVVMKKREIFEPPHLIMKQSNKKSRFSASVLDYKAVFNHSLLGIHGDIDRLKYLCLIINSKVFTYYQLMTNRKWLVERDELEAGDIWDTPIPEPSAEQLAEASVIFDAMKNSKGTLENLDAFVFLLYELHDYEVALINDAINYTYDYYYMKGKSKAFVKPTSEDILFYINTIKDILNGTFEKAIIMECQFFTGDAPLAVLLLKLEGHQNAAPVFCTESQKVIDELKELDGKLTEESQNVFIRRNVRVYRKDAIYIIKPMQQKYWNYSAACKDADDIFQDIMETWRSLDE